MQAEQNLHNGKQTCVTFTSTLVVVLVTERRDGERQIYFLPEGFDSTAGS